MAAVSDALARVPWRWRVEVLVVGDVGEVRRRLPAWVATLVEEPDGRVRATIRAENLDGAARLLCGLGLPFELLTPAELRPLLAEHAERIRSAIGA